jgi:DNA-binding MarR family transcriptional regulator
VSAASTDDRAVGVALPEGTPTDVALPNGTLADALLDAVGLLRRQVRRSAGRPFPGGNLTGAHGELMRTVRRRPGISITEAAADLGLAANTVSTLVAHLVGQELLTRTADPADRRVGRLELTEPARRRVGQWREHRAGLTARALARLDAADRDTLAAALPGLARLAELIREESR